MVHHLLDFIIFVFRNLLHRLKGIIIIEAPNGRLFIKRFQCFLCSTLDRVAAQPASVQCILKLRKVLSIYCVHILIERKVKKKKNPPKKVVIITTF